jgi:hypothetical protein
MAIQTVDSKDILGIQTISAPMPYAKGTKMEGQFYRRFNYDGKVFISNDESFYNELEAGGIESLKLDSNEDGNLSLVSYITFKKLIGLKRNNVTLESITIENYKPSALVDVSSYQDLATE